MKLIIVFSCLLIMLSACGASAEQRAAQTATAMTATAAAWTPTPTITDTPTRTPSPTPTESPLPTATATITSSPAPTQDLARYYAPDNSFSIRTPEGWQTTDLGLKFPALIGPHVENVSQNLIFIPDTSTFPMAMYAATVQDSVSSTYPDLTSILEEFLTTSSGIDYFHWVMERVQNDMKLRQVLYIVENGDWKLTVIYTRQAGEAPEQDAVIDAAFDTLRFEP